MRARSTCRAYQNQRCTDAANDLLLLGARAKTPDRHADAEGSAAIAGLTGAVLNVEAVTIFGQLAVFGGDGCKNHHLQVDRLTDGPRHGSTRVAEGPDAMSTRVIWQTGLR